MLNEQQTTERKQPSLTVSLQTSKRFAVDRLAFAVANFIIGASEELGNTARLFAVSPELPT